MAVESITDKKVLNAKSSKIFKGRLFYAIIPNKKDKSVTFYYTRANYEEGRSVARGLPLFIKDFFKIDPGFFCDSEFLAEVFQGEWCYSKRTFLSPDEKEERDRLNTMEDHANAEIQIFISKDQQIALAMDTDDVSVETRLTKGDAAPPPVPTDDVSDMTGSTRESKAQRYANAQVKEVASQYSTQITSMRTYIHDKDDKIAQLELRLQQMQNINPPPAPLPSASIPTKPGKVPLTPPPRPPLEKEEVTITVVDDDIQEDVDMQISTDKDIAIPPRPPLENENVSITVVDNDIQEVDDMQISTANEGATDIDGDDDISFSASQNSDLLLLDFLSGPVTGKRPMNDASSAKSKSPKKQQTSTTLALLATHQSSSSMEDEIL